MRRRKRRNIRWMKQAGSILIFLFLMSVVIFGPTMQSDDILSSYDAISEQSQNSTHIIRWQSKGVSLCLPMEYFLVGALAASVSPECETEVLKAQAILLRSSLKRKMGTGEKELWLSDDNWSYWTDQKMQKEWGELYEDHLKKCLVAIEETQGMYLEYQGKAIDGCYHGMSAGGTRAGAELSQEGEYGYLRETACADNLSATDYQRQQRIQKSKAGELSHAVCNELGYVISLQRDGETILGERFCEEMGLMSSNFTWKEEGDTYIFICRGYGHGFGMDQYYANLLAKKGKNYVEILDYFFNDVTYQKLE